MTKVAALYKAAPFLRCAQGAAMHLWRRPDLSQLAPTVVPVRTATQKAVATYWAHALSPQPAHGLTRSLRARTFLVVDARSACLLGLIALRDPRQADADRDAAIAWSGEHRQRRLPHLLDAARLLVPEPLRAAGVASIVALALLSDDVLGVVELREAATICAVTYTSAANDATLDGVDDVPEVTSADRRLRLFEPRANGLAFLRGCAAFDDLGPLRPFRPPARVSGGTCDPWDAERYTLPRLLLTGDS